VDIGVDSIISTRLIPSATPFAVDFQEPVVIHSVLEPLLPITKKRRLDLHFQFGPNPRSHAGGVRIIATSATKPCIKHQELYTKHSPLFHLPLTSNAVFALASSSCPVLFCQIPPHWSTPLRTRTDTRGISSDWGTDPSHIRQICEL
jgi:hypothetical protein